MSQPVEQRGRELFVPAKTVTHSAKARFNAEPIVMRS